MDKLPGLCSLVGCGRELRAKGMCGMHYMRLRQTGQLDLAPRPIRTCSVPGCDRPHEARGLCRRHYRKATYIPKGRPRTPAQGLRCAIKGCQQTVQARGWCARHYARWLRHGDPERDLKAERRNRRCSVPGCEERHSGNGYCARHYQQAKNRLPLTLPSPPVVDLPGERWRPVPGWEMQYSVSNLGRVKSLSRPSANGSRLPERLLTPAHDGGGYPWVSLYARPKMARAKVHHLVCEAFLGPRPPPLVVNHKNGIKTDNRAVNLEYVTSSENNRHAYRLGLKGGRGMLQRT